MANSASLNKFFQSNADTLDGESSEYYLNYNNLTNTPSLDNVATSGLYSDLSGTPDLATVATTGDYDDLTNRPTIPTDVSDLTDTTNIINPVLAFDLSDFTDNQSLIPSDLSDLTDSTSLIPSALTDLSITDGSDGQVLTTDGSGGFTFTTIAGVSTPTLAQVTAAGATTSENVTFGGNLLVSGDLTISGTSTTVNTSNLAVDDSLIKLATGNESSDLVDIGFYGHYYNGSRAAHAGMFRDASDGKFKIFSDYGDGGDDDTATIIDTSDVNFTLGVVAAGSFEGDLTGNADTATTLETARNIAGQSFDGSGDISVGLDDLSDVTITSASENDYLQYDGSGFVNKTPVIFKTMCIDENVNFASFTEGTIFNTSPDINQGGFSVTSTEITVPEDGIYMCSFNFRLSSATARVNVFASWGINNSNQGEYAASGYIRNANNHNNSSLHYTTLFNLSANDTLSVFFQREAENGTTTLDGGNSTVSVVKVG